eukprot:TRINITY_DN32554_c0_g1_i1.p1 TRINITY_DN32554_c0_g1~~TRINITY_DN32554_c0_g1_i1.p1  ORF type:complete len:366 (+),score=105.73 TRINITY_DN32554_c0_g1_i1:57-1100(+)
MAEGLLTPQSQRGRHASGASRSAASQGITDTPFTGSDVERRIAQLERVLLGDGTRRQLEMGEPEAPQGGNIEARVAHLERLVAIQEADKELGRKSTKGRRAQRVDAYIKGGRRVLRPKDSAKPAWAAGTVETFCSTARRRADAEAGEETKRQYAARAADTSQDSPVDLRKLHLAHGRSRSLSPCVRPGTQRSPRQEVLLKQMGYQSCRPNMTPPPPRKLCGQVCSARVCSVAGQQGWDVHTSQVGPSAADLRDRTRRHQHLSPRRVEVEGAAAQPSPALRAARVPPEPIYGGARRRSRSLGSSSWTPGHTSHHKVVAGNDDGNAGVSQRALQSLKVRHRIGGSEIML